jgi:plastocyanin
MRKRLVITILALALARAEGLARAEAPQPAEAARAATTTVAALDPRIGISQFRFDHSSLTVPVGTTVIWTNRDQDSHTVTSTDGVFSSPALDPGEGFSYRFTTSGTYTYYCALHPHMTARVIVK